MVVEGQAKVQYSTQLLYARYSWYVPDGLGERKDSATPWKHGRRVPEKIWTLDARRGTAAFRHGALRSGLRYMIWQHEVIRSTTTGAMRKHQSHPVQTAIEASRWQGIGGMEDKD